MRGWAPRPVHPGPGGERQVLAAREAPGGGRQGSHLPLGLVGQGLGPGEAQLQGQGGPLASSVGGCCLQPTMTPKVNEVSCVSGCMDAVCARLCSWAAGTTDEPGESSAENPG